MRRSRPVKCMARAAVRARSRERAVKSAMERSRRARGVDGVGIVFV